MKLNMTRLFVLFTACFILCSATLWPPNYGTLSCIHKGPVDSFGNFFEWDFTPIKGKVFKTKFTSNYFGSGSISYSLCEVPVSKKCGQYYNSSSLCVEGDHPIDNGGVTFGDFDNATWIDESHIQWPLFPIHAMYGTTAACGPIALTFTTKVHFFCSPDIPGDGQLIAPEMGFCNPNFFFFSKYGCPIRKKTS